MVPITELNTKYTDPNQQYEENDQTPPFQRFHFSQDKSESCNFE